MAACAESEIEENSVKEISCKILQQNNSAFTETSSTTGCTASYNTNAGKELSDQLRLESETGDLKELSDDEFLHLLKEASTFNKPNNEESVLLKQLRKEVAESDPCENVSRSETSCVSKRTDRKCSNVTYSGPSVEFPVTSHSLSPDCITTTLPPTTFKIFPLKTEKEVAEPSIVSEKDGNKRSQVSHHIIEIEPGNDNWTLKAKPYSETSQKASNQLSNFSESNKYYEHGPTTNSYIYDLNAFCSNLSNASSSGPESGRPKHKELKTKPLDCANVADLVCLRNKTVPTLVVGSCDFLTNEFRINENHSEQSSSKETLEIELTEFRHSRLSDVRDQDGKRESSPANVNSQQSNSKFYVNCGDVDTTVTFPLKFVPSVDERNGGSGIICDTMNDSLKRPPMGYPCFQWQRAQPVHSFLGTLPVDPESLQSQNDADSVGNPFSNRGRTNITSFVSATLLDYPNTTLIPDNQASKLDWSHRKHKRTRNHTENSRFILSENIAGHRGNEDIDSLVKFIEAADKNNKTLSRGNPNHTFTNKANSVQDTLKRKLNGKETKITQTKSVSLSKKKSPINMENSNSGHYNSNGGKLDHVNNKVISSESELSDDSCSNKIKMSSSESVMSPPLDNLDINSNVVDNISNEFSTSVNRDGDNMNVLDEDVDNSPLEQASTPVISSFASDFYSVSDGTPQVTEDSGFCIVKKKQRKKHQGKRSENYRWQSVAARVRQNTSGEPDYYSKEQTHGNSIILLSGMPLAQRSQCGNPDSRRKSTSSVPHSEQSSADNSDLDSVHSLPVRGSAPHPTKAHPHTTPSSSSSTPQASYADIARMPVASASKLSSPSVNSGTPPSVTKPLVVDKSICQTDPKCNAEEVSSLAPKSIDSSSNESYAIQATSPSPNKLTRETNTQTECIVNSEESTQIESDVINESNPANTNMPVENVIDSVSTLLCKDEPCVCYEDKTSKSELSERTQRPAVVMMGSIPTMEASDISFGIDLKEILQISSGENASFNLMESLLLTSSATPDIDKQQCPSVSSTEACCGKANSSKSSSSDNCLCNCEVSDQDSISLCEKASSPCTALCLFSGQKLQFREREVNMQMFNYNQIVDLFAREWRDVENEFISGTNKAEEKVKYYEDGC